MSTVCASATQLVRAGGVAKRGSAARSSRRPALVVRAGRDKGGGGPVDNEFGGAVTGAVLGGLLLGPFGAIIGGNLGAEIGADRREKKEAEAEIRRQGLTPELVAMVQECAEGLQQAEAALSTTKTAYNAALQRAADLDAEASELYNLAAAAMNDGNEDKARGYLVERKQVQSKFQDAKSDAAAAKARVNRTQQSVDTLAEQAIRLEGVVKDAMAGAAEDRAAAAAAKFGGAAPGGGGSITDTYEDDLERRFRELEGRGGK